jgi:hypothetical protein
MSQSDTQLHFLAGDRDRDNRDVTAHVIFVHGLGGGPIETWQQSKECGEDYWPCWLCEDVDRPEDGRSIKVWSLDYPSEMIRVMFFSDRRMQSLPDRGRNLANVLVTQDLAKRPIIFVAHSLGGLIVKQMLRCSWDARYEDDPLRELAISTRAVVFLGTPHSGTSVANLAERIETLKGVAIGGLIDSLGWLPFAEVMKKIGKFNVRRGKFLEALKYGDPHLDDLRSWYAANSRPISHDGSSRRYGQLSILTTSFFETLPTYGVVVVDRVTANPGIGKVVGLDSNHRQICKPSSRDDDLYKHIKGPIIDAVRSAPIMTETNLAVLDSGIRFIRLSELDRDERLFRVKKVIHPLEARLGRLGLDDTESEVTRALREVRISESQELAAATSEYDLDRIILYVLQQYGLATPHRELSYHVGLETERLKPNRYSKRDVTLIPLYYAVKSLDERSKKAPDRQLTDTDKYKVKAALELVEELAERFGEDGDLTTRNRLRKLLDMPNVKKVVTYVEHRNQPQ